MKFTQTEVKETLKLYEDYCKIMDIKDLPIITFNKTECIKALDHPTRIRATKRHFKNLGICTYKQTIDNITYNTVIYINTEIMVSLNGLHEYTDWKTVQKRKHTYQQKFKIGHLEETLIHELLHHKRPSLRHGTQFQMLIKSYYRAYHKNQQQVNSIIKSEITEENNKEITLTN